MKKILLSFTCILMAALLAVPALAHEKGTLSTRPIKASKRPSMTTLVQQKVAQVSNKTIPDGGPFRYAGPCEEAPTIQFAGKELALRCDFGGGVFSDTQTSNVYYWNTRNKFRREDVSVMITWDREWLADPGTFDMTIRDWNIQVTKEMYVSKDAYEMRPYNNGNVVLSGYNNDQDYHRGWLSIYRTFDQGHMLFELRVPPEIENDEEQLKDWRRRIVNEAASLPIPAPYDMHQS